MSSTDVSTDASTATPAPGTIDMKLEVITIPVSDVDRAKAFYASLGWRLDIDLDRGRRPGSADHAHPSGCSIQFGKGHHAGLSRARWSAAARGRRTSTPPARISSAAASR